MSDLVERLNSLIAERAGGGPSEATYDPELLAIGFAVADRIEQIERVLADARMVFASVNEYTPSDIAVIFPEQIAAIDEALK